MKKLGIIFVVTAFTFNASAAEVLVTTSTLTTSQKLEKLASQMRDDIKDGDFVSSYDYLLSHPATEAQMAVILDLDSDARTASLNGNFKKAEADYEKLLRQLSRLPAVAGLDKLMLATKINLAQTSTTLKKPNAESLWKEARAWDPSAHLSPEEYSPAVILKFAKPAQITAKRAIEINTPKDTVLFIDGRMISGTDKNNHHTVRLETGHHQAAALTPGGKWVVNYFEAKDLKKPLVMTLKPALFVAGACDAPEFKGDQVDGTHKVLVRFSDDCSRVYSGGHWFNIDGSPAQVKTVVSSGVKIPSRLTPDSSDDSESALQGRSTSFAKPAPSFLSRMIHSPVFWAGVGAVVVGALVISHNQPTSSEPSHTVSN